METYAVIRTNHRPGPIETHDFGDAARPINMQVRRFIERDETSRQSTGGLCDD